MSITTLGGSASPDLLTCSTSEFNSFYSKPYSDDLYIKNARGRLDESIFEYLCDDLLQDKFCDHLKETLLSEYKERLTQAEKVKEVIAQLFPDEAKNL